jgi:hypothetical protein
MPLQQVAGRDVSVEEGEPHVEHGGDENQVGVEGRLLRAQFAQTWTD